MRKIDPSFMNVKRTMNCAVYLLHFIIVYQMFNILCHILLSDDVVYTTEDSLQAQNLVSVEINSISVAPGYG